MLDDAKLTLVDNFEEAQNFMRWLGERRHVLAIDTESGGLNPLEVELRLVQFGDHDSGWSIPWHLWAGLIKEALENYEGDTVYHNRPYDLRVFAANGVNIEPMWRTSRDTMLEVHLDDTSKSKKLKTTCARMFGNASVAGQSALDDLMKTHKYTWATVPWDHPYYWGYGALDTVLTARLDERLYPGVRKLYSDVFDMELEVQRICANMTMRGARVDIPYCEKTIDRLLQWSEQMNAWLSKKYGISSVGARMDLIEYFQKKGVDFTELTAGGGVKLDKDVLKQLAAEGHELADHVLAVRKADKLSGTYLKNFIEMALHDGKAHPSINTVGARTGRMSMDLFQTLPRKDPTIRKGVIPSDGNVLITCDADQIEMRLMAHFSKDPGLIDAFESDDDFFCTVASEVYDDDVTQEDPRRSLTKNFCYALIYGSGTATMAQTAGQPYEVMETMRESFAERFPHVKMFMDGVEKNAGHPPSIMTPMGRRLVADPRKAYTLVNYLHQGHAAEIFKKSLIEADSAGLGDYMVLPVHDEIVLDIPKEEAKEASVALVEAMEDRDGYAVPITWSADIIDGSWGLKYEGKK